MSKMQCSSYVYHGDKFWNVSTISRLSSTYEPTEYNETIVWNMENRETLSARGKMVGQYEDSRDSLRCHLDICKAIHATGIVPSDWPESNQQEETTI